MYPTLSPLSRVQSTLSLTEKVAPLDPGDHGALLPGRVAVITGAASGIGFAAAKQLAEEGLKIVLADLDHEQLEKASREIAKIAGENNVLVVPTDVSQYPDVLRLKEKAFETFGEVSVLLNNAGINPPGGKTFTGIDQWKRIMDTNFYGILHVQQAFIPAMIHQENPAVIINTGSKQGITNPPGNPAYNTSKAAVKFLTEALAHELRESHADVTAHLFVPGWTYTGMTGASEGVGKPGGAWTAQQTVQYMLKLVRLGYFYIIVPDNETPPELDRLRMQWASDDMSEGRPALSRWHPEFKPLFEEYVREGLSSEDRIRTRSSSRLRTEPEAPYSTAQDNL